MQYWLNLLFKPPRGGHGAESAVCIYENTDSPGRCRAEYIADVTTVIHVITRRSDSDNITERIDAAASILAQSNVVAASGVVNKRRKTIGGVTATSRIVPQR